MHSRALITIALILILQQPGFQHDHGNRKDIAAVWIQKLRTCEFL